MSLSIHDDDEPQLVAQKLNDLAADFIECGQYSLAISSLIKALRQLLEQADNESVGCSCRHCSLEACLAFSKKTSRSSRLFQKSSTFSSSSSKHHPIHRQQTSDELSSEDGYIYRQPIRVRPQSTREGHSMGPALHLILTFNLALVHHLSAMEDEQVSRNKFQKVLRLYELAYRYCIEEEYDQVDCILFTMIISNNLGEIHRVVNNTTKHVVCLEYLLSTMVFMVHYMHNNNEDSLELELELELDGFLRNACQLILQGQCAGAA
jgi:hypothetical protein